MGMSVGKWKAIAGILLAFASLLVVAYTVDYLHTETPALRTYRGLRAAYSLLAGGVLGACGVYLQSSLRNPLVDHYVLGIGSGALLTFYLSLLLADSLAIGSLLSVIGGLLSLGLTISLAERLSGSEVSYVLSGLAVNSLFSGLSIMLSYIVIKSNPYASLYMVGSFVLASRGKLYPAMLSLIIVIISYIFLAKPMNAIIFGDTHAKQVGYDPRKVRLASVLAAGISSSIIVSLFGVLGFIGLVSPHISRLLLRTGDNRLVIPASFVVGSSVLYLTDFASRRLLAGVTGEIPAGAIASVLGAPFFLILLLTRLRGRAI